MCIFSFLNPFLVLSQRKIVIRVIPAAWRDPGVAPEQEEEEGAAGRGRAEQGMLHLQLLGRKTELREFFLEGSTS